jgi:hypothetical protein
MTYIVWCCPKCNTRNHNDSKDCSGCDYTKQKEE